MNRRNFIQNLPSLGVAMALPSVVGAEQKAEPKFKSFVTNCYLKPRGEKPMFFETKDSVFATLDGYAIVPIEHYKELNPKAFESIGNWPSKTECI